MISFALTVARKDLLLTFTRGSGLVQGLLLGLQLFAHIFILGQPFYGFALRKAACHVHAGQRRPGAAGRAVGNAFHTGPSCAGYCAACSSCASSARQPASIWAYAVSKSRVYQGSAMSPGVPV